MKLQNIAVVVDIGDPEAVFCACSDRISAAQVEASEIWHFPGKRVIRFDHPFFRDDVAAE